MALSTPFQKALLQQCMPFLRFAPTERFFPSDVNAWITSAFTEKWSSPLSHKGGNAVLKALNDDTFPIGFPTAADVIVGFHAPAGTRLEPASLGTISNGVRELVRGRQDVFMDFAGWPPESGGTGATDFTRGSPENIYPPFSVLAESLNSANAVETDTLQLPQTAASPHTTQGNAPTFYGQADWAGRFSRMSDQLEAAVAGSGDFGPSNSLRDALDKLIVLTYYFFYPLTDMPPGADAAQGISAVQREGQWEAVSLFFKFEPDFSQAVPGDGVPGDAPIPIPDFSDPAEGAAPTLIALVYSSTMRSDDPAPPAEVRFADSGDVDYPLRDGGDGLSINPATEFAPAVYVTSGIHKNMFGPVATKTTTDEGPNTDLIDAAAAVAAAAGGASAIPVLGWIAGLILALIAIILVIFASVFRNSSTTYTPSGPDDDFVPPGGPSTGPPNSSGVSPTLGPPTLEIFSQLPAPAGTGNDPLYQLPPWWNFCGRWGIRVLPSSDARWDNGMRFTDAQGRNRAYWNTLALLAFISQDANATKALTLIN